MRFGGPCRGLDLVTGCVGHAEGDVGGDRVGEEERVLEHHADAAPQRVEPDVAHVDAVDRDAARMHVVEAREHQPHRRLPGTGAADQRDGLARRDREVEVVQHGIGRRVTERHVLEAHFAARHGEREGVGCVLHEGSRVEEVVDALGAGAGELTHGEDRGELPDRRRDQQHVRGEREEGPEADAAVEREPTSDGQHGDLTQRGNRLHRGLQPGLDVHEPDARTRTSTATVPAGVRARAAPGRSPSRRARR